MKNVLILITLSLFLFAGCGDDDASPNNQNGSNAGNISFTLDGEDFNSELGVGGFFTDVAGVQTFLISGFRELGISDLASINFGFPTDQSVEETTYLFSNMNCDSTTEVCGVVSFIDDGVTFGSTNGTGVSVTVSSVDFQKGGHIRGTFSGTMTNADTGEDVTLVNGSFDVPIVE